MKAAADPLPRAVSQVLKALRPALETMYDRWQDEKEYEDFANYKAYAKDFVPEQVPGAECRGLTKSPFTLTVLYEGYTVVMKVTAKALTLTYSAPHPLKESVHG